VCGISLFDGVVVGISIFDSFLTSPEMTSVFDDTAVIDAMFRFEATLAEAQAAEGIIPEAAARAIVSVCNAQLYDIAAIVNTGRRAGSLAIPLVKELTKTVALYDKECASHVHWGSTSQDVLDTAMVLVTKQALILIQRDLDKLITQLLNLARTHLATPVLARTLMQPAQVTSFGLKLVNWAAPLLRARAHLQASSERALQLQLGGAVGTLSVMGDKGLVVAARMATALDIRQADSAWHTQRDEWIRLGMEVAVLTGSLGKIATDLSLMAQGEIAELAEPSGNGRGGSTAMPHKRNPVSAMIALAGALRTPQRAAALLSAMDQQHERGLGNWQAELAEWPGLFLSAHGALSALTDAFAGLHVDTQRMQSNIDALQGLIFAEAASIYLASVIGRPDAHHLLEQLTAETISSKRNLRDVLTDAVKRDSALSASIDINHLQTLFDPVAATASAQRAALHQLQLFEQ
jgi:3-carboxy-cis,cis-muconate cycloisomerase